MRTFIRIGLAIGALVFVCGPASAESISSADAHANRYKPQKCGHEEVQSGDISLKVEGRVQH
jgi:hypothetical protein